MSAYAASSGFTVDAYFAWSLMDNYEWAGGFTTRFSITYVDYNSQAQRPKLSAAWLAAHATCLASPPTDGRPLPPCDPALLAQARWPIYTASGLFVV